MQKCSYILQLVLYGCYHYISILFYIEVYMVIQGQQLLHGDQWTFSQKNGSGHHTPLGSLLAVELAALAACCAHCCQAFLFSCALRAQLH